MEHTLPGSKVYTDEWNSYRGLPFDHSTIKHSARQYVKGKVTTNGIESFWSTFKKGYKGTYHWMSFKHLHRYVTEFTGRHDDRPYDTIEQMGRIAERMVHKRLRYGDLVAN